MVISEQDEVSGQDNDGWYGMSSPNLLYELWVQREMGRGERREQPRIWPQHESAFIRHRV